MFKPVDIVNRVFSMILVYAVWHKGLSEVYGSWHDDSSFTKHCFYGPLSLLRTHCFS